ncbi:PAS domain S-box protein [Candidatus Atribacteria bacterium MT.SAG.1]|nr:PAS domain S-box protein [Candidatus Atribacteria bacterium MT.SAG.1]
MFKKPYGNELSNIKSREKTKEELLKEIEYLHQRINNLEKLRNTPRKVKEESEKYFDPPEKAVTTCTLELTNVNEQLLRGITGSQKAEDSLLDIKRNYEEIGTVILDTFIVADDEGRIVFWNKAAEKMYGCSSKEALRKPLTTFLISFPFHEAFKRNFTEFKKTGKGSIVGKILEFNTKKKDGIRFPVEMSLSSIEINKKWHSVAIIRDITKRKQAEKRLRQSYQELEKMVDNTVNALVKIIELRDPYTSGHQKRVSRLALAIARELGLSEREVKLIKIAALVHDIGKTSIPAEILSKPDKLAEIEFSLIRTHSQTGYDILKNINFPWAVEEIVLQHHERIDGSGYPHKLKGDKILVEAKIMGVADVVEAMSSHRPYRPALGIDKALEEISQNRGILYDPEVVDVCLKLFREKRFKF